MRLFPSGHCLLCINPAFQELAEPVNPGFKVSGTKRNCVNTGSCALTLTEKVIQMNKVYNLNFMFFNFLFD